MCKAPSIVCVESTARRWWACGFSGHGQLGVFGVVNVAPLYRSMCPPQHDDEVRVTTCLHVVIVSLLNSPTMSCMMPPVPFCAGWCEVIPCARMASECERACLDPTILDPAIGLSAHRHLTRSIPPPHSWSHTPAPFPPQHVRPPLHLPRALVIRQKYNTLRWFCGIGDHFGSWVFVK